MKLNKWTRCVLSLCALTSLATGCAGRLQTGEHAGTMVAQQAHGVSSRGMSSADISPEVVSSAPTIETDVQLQSRIALRRQVLDNIATMTANPWALPTLSLPAEIADQRTPQPVDRILSTYQAIAAPNIQRHPAAVTGPPLIHKSSLATADEFVPIIDARNLAAIDLELRHAIGLQNDSENRSTVEWMQRGAWYDVPADCEFHYGRSGDTFVWVPVQGREKLGKLVDALVAHATVPGEIAEQFVAANTLPTTDSQNANQYVNGTKLDASPSAAFEQLFNPRLPLMADQQRRYDYNRPHLAKSPQPAPELKRVRVADDVENSHQSQIIQRMSHEAKSEKSQSPQLLPNANAIPVTEKFTTKSTEKHASYIRQNGFLIRQ